jgi:hypothetical protein
MKVHRDRKRLGQRPLTVIVSEQGGMATKRGYGQDQRRTPMLRGPSRASARTLKTLAKSPMPRASSVVATNATDFNILIKGHRP